MNEKKFLIVFYMIRIDELNTKKNVELIAEVISD